MKDVNIIASSLRQEIAHSEKKLNIALRRRDYAGVLQLQSYLNGLRVAFNICENLVLRRTNDKDSSN